MYFVRDDLYDPLGSAAEFRVTQGLLDVVARLYNRLRVGAPGNEAYMDLDWGACFGLLLVKLSGLCGHLRLQFPGRLQDPCEDRGKEDWRVNQWKET